MIARVLFLLALSASGAYAASCRSYLVLGVYATQAECEKARQLRLVKEPTLKCVQCD
jgi:hypothetical protein